MSAQQTRSGKQKKKVNLALVIAGVLLIVIGASIALVSTAEWELPFAPTDPDPRNPPGESSATGPATTTTTTVTTAYTWTVTPTTEFRPKASVRIIGTDGNVLKEYRLFAIWEMGEKRVAYIEVPFYVSLGAYGTVTNGPTVTYVVPTQRVQVVLYIKIRHENISAIVVTQVVQALINAVLGENNTKPTLLDYRVTGENEVMVVFEREKVVTGSWAGSFYFVPDTVFSDLYKTMGDAAFGTYEISIAMKVILPEKSLGMGSSWVTVTLTAEPYEPGSGGGGGGGNPPGVPGNPPVPLAVVWEP